MPERGCDCDVTQMQDASLTDLSTVSVDNPTPDAVTNFLPLCDTRFALASLRDKKMKKNREEDLTLRGAASATTAANAELRAKVARQQLRLAKDRLKRARKQVKDARREAKRLRKRAAAEQRAWNRALRKMRKDEKQAKNAGKAPPRKKKRKVAAKRKAVASKRAGKRAGKKSVR